MRSLTKSLGRGDLAYFFFIVKSNALVYDLRNETYKSLPYEISD